MLRTGAPDKSGSLKTEFSFFLSLHDMNFLRYETQNEWQMKMSHKLRVSMKFIYSD